MRKQGILMWLLRILLMIYAGIVLVIQFFDMRREKYDSLSVPQLFERQYILATLTNEVARDQVCVPLSAYCRNLDQILPKNAKVFVLGLLGKDNASKGGYYNFLRYYLFPRQVAYSLGAPKPMTPDGFIGDAPTSVQQLLNAGFDLSVEFPTNHDPVATALHPLQLRTPSNSGDKNTRFDFIIAFLFPLFTSVAGAWLIRFIFPQLLARMHFMETAAAGLGLGMMAVAAITLGMKLIGIHGYRFIFVIILLISIWEAWLNRHRLWKFPQRILVTTRWHPALLLMVLFIVLLFRLASLEGLQEFDAVSAWMMKAKIMHLCTSDDLLNWFSTSSFSSANMEWPTLVSTLHAATWDALGHVNEFVSKFWPAWQLFFLITGIGSVLGAQRHLSRGPASFLLAITLLPATIKYVSWEGGAMPMMFFATLGVVQCVIAMQDQDGERIALGLSLLFGAAMAKFEGIVLFTLASAGMVMLMFFYAWLRPFRPHMRAVIFCLLSIIPYLFLRLLIPVMHFLSNWADVAAQNTGATLALWPKLVLRIGAHCLLSNELATWTMTDGHLTWAGSWQGIGSLFNQNTLGLSWIVIIMTIIAWIVSPPARKILLWLLLPFVGMLGTLALIDTNLYTIKLWNSSYEDFQDHTIIRYLLPFILAWGCGVLCLLFRGRPMVNKGS